MDLDILCGENIDPEPLKGIREAVSQELDSHPAEGSVEGDFPFQDLARDRGDQLVKHKVGKVAVVFRFGIGDAAGEMGDLDNKISSVFQKAVDFFENPVKVLQMFQDMLRIDPVDGTVFQRIRKLVEVEGHIRVIPEIDIHPEGFACFIITAAKVQNGHRKPSFLSGATPTIDYQKMDVVIKL